MKSFQSIDFTVIAATVGGQSRLEQAFDSLVNTGSGVSAGFALPNWPSDSGYASWNESGFRNPTSKVIRWLTKNVSGNAPVLHQYDELTDTISTLYSGNPSDPSNTSLTGHAYTSHTMDPETSDYYFMPWDKAIRKFNNVSSGAWPVQSTASTPWSGSSTPVPLAYSSKLFGNGNPGYVVISRTTVYVVRKSTGAVTTLGTYAPSGAADHQSLHTMENGDVILTQGIGSTLQADGYAHPLNTVTMRTYKVTAGTTPTLSRLQDAPCSGCNKIGSHSTDPRANHLVSVGTRAFTLECGDNSVGARNRAWELETRAGDTFPKWYLKSWTHAMQATYPVEPFIAIPVHSKGGFLSLQSLNPYTSLANNKARIWIPGDP